MNYPWIPVGSFLVSVVGAWLLGHLLPKTTKDSALAEKIQMHRGRLFLLVFVVVLVSAILWFPWQKADWSMQLAVVVIPFMILMLIWNGIGIMIGDFPKRKVLFEERWHIVQFLGSMLRIYLGLSGFWLVLFLTPFAVHAAGTLKWIFAGFLFLALMAWSRRFHRVTSAILGARPLADPELLARFSAIQQQSLAPNTEVLVMGPELGSFSNAFALPAIKDPRILISKPLLSVLEPKEAAAIFAHEMAHIEDFDRKKLGKLRLAEDLLIFAACLPIALIVQFASSFIAPFLFAWLPIVFAFLIYRTRSSQQNETNSDLRAVELAGDGEALIRGLVKLHAANRMPRRLAVEVEKSSTHPSLARRIRDIREAMQSLGQTVELKQSDPDDPQGPPAKDETQIGKPHLFWSREKKGELLILEENRIHQLTLAEEDLPEQPCHIMDPDFIRSLKDKSIQSRSQVLRELVELRLIIKRKGPGLRMVDRTGKPRVFPIAEEDLASVQTVLDGVDTRLSSSKITAAMELNPVRLWAFATGILGFLASFQGLITHGETIWLLIATIAVVVVPKRSGAFAISAMAVLIGFSQLAFTENRDWWSASGWFYLIAMFLSGLAVFWQTRRRKSDEPDKPLLELGHPGKTALFWFVVGSPFLFIYLSVLAGGDLFPKLFALGLNGKSVFAPLLAAAGALMAGRLGSKLVGSLFLALALSPLFLGSRFFLQNVVRDPLMVSAPVVEIRDAPYRLLAETRIDTDQPWSFRLSPGGRRCLAIKSGADDYLNMEKTFILADFGVERQTVKALDIGFIDDERILALEILEDKLEIRSYSLTDLKTPVWRLHLPGLELGGDSSLSVFGDTWRLVMGSQADITHWWTGKIGDDGIDRRAWYHPVRPYHARFPGNDDRCLEVVWGNEDPHLVFSAFHNFYSPTTIRIRDGENLETLAVSMLSVDLREPRMGAGGLLFMAHGSDRSRIWAVDIQSGGFHPLAQIKAGLAWSWDGSLMGVLEESAFLLIDPEKARGVRVPLPQKFSWSAAVDLRESVIGICQTSDKNKELIVYLLQKPTISER